MKLLMLIVLTMSFHGLHAQWNGTYYGTVNGDDVVMTLKQEGDKVTGDMKDTYQVFSIEGTVSGDHFTGTTVEQQYKKEFGLEADKIENTLECVIIVDMNGTMGEVPFTVEKRTLGR